MGAAEGSGLHCFTTSQPAYTGAVRVCWSAFPRGSCQGPFRHCHSGAGRQPRSHNQLSKPPESHGLGWHIRRVAP